MASLRLKSLAVIQLSLFIVLVDGFPFGSFDCGNGRFVPYGYLCDGDDDCRNGADERNCVHDDDSSTSRTARPSVPSTYRDLRFLIERRFEGQRDRFDCGNGRTVPNIFLCDGGDDCRNGADERNCSHVRFDCGNERSVPNSFLCDGDDDCRNGADEKNCTHERFDCGNGRSVPLTFLCDGGNDCRNGADEMSCSHVGFHCGNGRTVQNIFLCDGGDDCGNGADERNCSHVRFDCGNGRSVRNGFLCDGEDDCRNGADERNCSHVRFDCGNGRTVPKMFLCDGGYDCSNGADEKNCSHVEFHCGDGNTVPQHYLCDGDDDCESRADESNCNLGEFHCGDGNTVPQNYLCDGEYDCENRADERNCSLGTTAASITETRDLVLGIFFNCGNNRYVRVRSLCDGSDDCGNNADERNCNQEPDDAVKTLPVVSPVFLKENASIRSPNFPQNYPNNVNVYWNVSTVPGHRIKVVFMVKELEDSRNCNFDNLSLYDGHEQSSSSLGVYCRHEEDELPEPVVSSSHAMLVQFTTDGTVSWQGFQLDLSTVCGGTLVAQSSENEFLSHTRFGEQAYGENVNCDWIIKGGPERNVQISFSDFDVGTAFQISNAEKLLEEIEVNGCGDSDTGDCVRYNVPKENSGTDFVEVYDGPGSSSMRIGKYTGDQKPPKITSRGEELLIRFRSGSTGNFRGFRVVYQEV